ncbi:hypothetical protein Q5P01_014763 [Channa striata]|uniref:Coiled-coil domain-containing protein 157 n=1 Tax=Channa striata TaxID=64152 RepID=A0AA88MGM4_CHASR|nr:hypothetical protein Q5P01_014763 [Channa striata]
MSHFLGHQECIESLRKDLVDLQGAILDVFSRTGPIRFSSWKFPDKLSCNLDMVGLLEQYDFVEGEDTFNQHSHIVLLELVVDRLLLLLQSSNCYVEQLMGSHHREQSPQRGCQSVGLVVRNYWSNLVQFAKQKTKPKQYDSDETEAGTFVSPQMSSKSDSSRHCRAAWSSTKSFEFSPQNTPCNTKDDRPSKSCQTVESSLIPCNACHQVQSILRKTGDALVDLFQSEGLPCSLQPFLAAVEDTLELGHMTAGDVAQWANEQLRDMRRLAKHLQDVRSTVQPLKDRLAAAETEREKFRSQLNRTQKEFKQEVEKHQANIVQLEFSLRKAERSMKEIEQRLQDENQQLKSETLSLEASKSSLREKVAVQQDMLQALEHEKHTLQEEVMAVHRLEEEACSKLQQRIQQLQNQVSEMQVRLDKENAKFHSACRQQESMQAKQKSLLGRVDALDKECEELQRQLGESEERQLDLHSQLQQMSKEKEHQQAQLTQQLNLCLELKKEKETLEIHIGELKQNMAELKEYVQASRERERLLVAFPELSPLAQSQPQTTGNVLLDMEQQLQANSIRIKVLEQENTTLHSSLEKLRERAQFINRNGSPQQTWSPSQPSTPVENQHHHLTQMQKSALQHSSKIRVGYNKRGKEARGGENGPESATSENLVSAATASPLSLEIYLPNPHLSTGSSAAKSLTKTTNPSLLSCATRLNKER